MRAFAKVISLLFHPLTMLTYIVIVLLLINPYIFGKSNLNQGWWLIAQVFMSTFLLPAFAVAMMKNLGLVASYEMEDRTDRIIPFIATGMFYLWVFMSVRKSNVFPQIYTIAVLGATIALFIAFFINLFSKISIHAVGVGGLLGMILIAIRWFSYSYFYWGQSGDAIPIYWVLIAAILLAGLVCTARLLLDAHEPKDIIQGFGVGVFGMWVAAYILI
jgi:hypothetical protein